jgi:TP901 family phage tail tape measure protein
MLAVLKQGGLDVKNVLEGTGEAVAGLAIITHQQPKALAEPFAQYVQLFDLKGKETTKLADVLARLRFATGLTPQELIEGAKFFQTRAGMPLGLTGLQGAEQSGRLLATLRSRGLEGGIGGRELGGFTVGLTFNSKEQQKKLAELKAKHGITLEFFDSKGGFKGFENVFAQMEKLRNLSTEQRLEFGEKLFGKEGMGIASIMMKAGVQGWNEINARIDKTAGSQEMLNQVTQTYNNKMESLLGTIDNLKATAFTPMLDTLKPVVDLTNTAVGGMQEFAKDHQTLASFSTHLVGVGSAGLVATGGIKAAIAAAKLWQISRAVSSGDATLLDVVTGKVPKAEWSFRKAGIGMGKALVTGFAVGAPLFLIERLMEGAAQTRAAEQRAFEAGERLGQMIREGMRQQIEGKLSETAMNELRKVRAEQEAKPRVEQIGIPQTSEAAGYFGGASEFNKRLAAVVGEKFYVQKYAGNYFDILRGNTGYLKKPRGENEDWIRGKLQALFLYYPEQLKNILEETKRQYQAANEPEMFVEFKRLAAETYPKLMEQIDGSGESLRGLDRAASALASSFARIGGSIPSYIPSFPQFSDRVTGRRKSGFNFDVINPPSRAMGGDVLNEGIVHIHKGERIVRAADVTRGYPQRANVSSPGSRSMTGGNISLKFYISKDAPAAQSPRALATAVAHEVRRQRERR